uniref:Uncharacterized protein n=1 Tax=Pithovirus LCPAC401 TaxID=2506595 RepID=A0A481ZAR8_9VIRU|nr:MAG: hypothetical protein LCPAC401_02030 [Pithovirus LCPAC401]
MLKCATNDNDLIEYLQLQLKISEIDADIAFQGGNYPGEWYKGGIPELKVILKEKKRVRKKREQNDSKRMERALT